MSDGAPSSRWTERARLQRIETQLAASDPALGAVFRSWRHSGSGSSVSGPSHDETVPLWAGITFVVAFTVWLLGPQLAILLGLAAFWWVRRTSGNPLATARARQPGRRRSGS
jgi:Protein of unknown function (DUF3040)